jgi:hypothetical protein
VASEKFGGGEALAAFELERKENEAAGATGDAEDAWG